MKTSFLPRDTVTALTSLSIKDCGRSLYFDRYARPDLSKEDRHKFFTDGFAAHTYTAKAGGWSASVAQMHAETIYAQLQSRLMVNMAGGVMENAGLCVDRFGLPYIRGSAAKGCTRRVALAALHEWCETGVRPGDEQDGQDNLFKATCAQFQSPPDMLAAIARVFGWSEQDWSDLKTEGRFKSDFAWACGSTPSPDRAKQTNATGWSTIRYEAVCRLADGLGLTIAKDDSTPWKRLPNFAGSASFLPAYPLDLGQTGKVEGLPLDLPVIGKLDLDVVTCHHPTYYRGDLDIAMDTEDPNPVVFPTVALGHVFAFAVAKLRSCTDDDLKLAQTWLATGLATFGLGAKTNAGYGWFDTSDELQNSIRSFQAQKAANEEAERQRIIEKEAEAKAERDRLIKKRDLEEKRASMTEAEKEDFDLDEMTPDPRLQWIEKFHARTDPQKLAIYRLLRTRNPDLWRALRDKAEKGKQKERQRFSPVVQAMFKMAKDRKEKMPK
jgi:CRISPR-associated protein Cmr6